MKLKPSVWSQIKRRQAKVKLNLDLKYKKLPMGEKQREVTPAELTRLIINNLVAAKYPSSDKGSVPMPRNESRIWGKIQDVFGDEPDAIELDGTQFDFLSDLVDKTDLPQQFSSWLWVVRDYFDSVKKDGEKEPEKLKAVTK